MTRGFIELPLEDTIDVHTAARMAAVSDNTVRRWCDEGRIACCKPAGRWRIFRSQFLAWIQSSITTPVQLHFRFPKSPNNQSVRNA